MNARSASLHSTVIHAAILLGLAIVACEPVELDDWDAGEGDGVFRCRLVGPTGTIDRIERARDQFGSPIPSDEEAPTSQVYATDVRLQLLPEDEGPRFICCECGCGGAATTLVAWPRDIVSTFERKFWMATSHARGLKSHARTCASRGTGVETDCNCGLVPRQY